MKYLFNRCKSFILLFLVIAVCTGSNAEVNNENVLSINLEVKEFDDKLVFIFYHHRNDNVKLVQNKNLVSALFNKPIELQFASLNNFKQYANISKISADKRSLSFSIKKEIIGSGKIINGERLTAISFDLSPKEEIKSLSKDISSKDESEKKLDPDVKGIVDKDKPLVKEILYKISKDTHKLFLDFGKKDTNLMLFVRGKYLWIVSDHKQNFTLPSNNINLLSDFKQINHDEYTILRFRMASSLFATVAKKDNIWGIMLVPSEGKNVGTGINVHTESGAKLVVDYDFSNSIDIEIEDELVGDKIKLFLLKIPGSYSKKYIDLVDFSILPSAQGIAVAVSNDNDVEVRKIKKSLTIATNKKATNDIKEDLPKKRLTPVKGSILPLEYIYDKDFLATRSNLVTSCSLAEDEQTLYLRRMELAKFFFLNQLYREATVVLDLIKEKHRKMYDQDVNGQFLTAVSSTLQGVVDKPLEIYNNLISNTYDQENNEIVLWNQYNDFLVGKSPKLIAVLENFTKFVNNYPDQLYWNLVLADIDIAINANNLKRIEAIFKELRTPTLGNNANSLQFYKAMYYRKKGQHNLAKQFLQDLMQKEGDLFNFVRAKMALVKLQVSNKEINLAEAIKQLEQLRFLWRGDTLEYDLLQLLGRYYKDVNDNITALRTYNYLSRAFNNKISNFYITSEMVKIFNSIFLAGGKAENMSAFDAVALFYEFQDLNPVGAEGDEVILLICKKLIELDLLDQAVNILKHQVSYRLTGEKRVINANHLAVALLMNKQPQEAIEVLDETDIDNNKFNEHQYRVRLKAKALIDMKKYDEGLEMLAKDYSEDAMILKKECLFRSERLKDYAELIAPMLNELGVGAKISDATQQDVLRLGLAYYMLSEQALLEKLASSNIAESCDAVVKDTLNLLTTSVKPIDYKNLDRSLSIDQMQTLLNKYKTQLFQ